MINNIGLDGLGTHCGITNRFKVEMECDGREEFVLPEHIEILNETMEAFGPLQYAYNKILVMIQDIQECINVLRTLIAHEILWGLFKMA